jgi:hypothetical protein
MLDTPNPVPDPRVFPDIGAATESARGLYLLAEQSLRTETAQRADAVERELRDALLARLIAGGPELAAMLAGAPSVEVTRQLWRSLDRAWREATADGDATLAVTMFAVPLVIVVGREGTDDDGVLAGILADPAKLAGILREHRALGGNQTFVFSNALVAADAIDVARLPEIFAWCRLPDPDLSRAPTLRVFAPAPVEYGAGRESVHLRFLVGGALAKPGVDLTTDTAVGKWGVPLMQEMVAQLGSARASVLALPRAPQRLLPAVAQGRAAQREIAAQIFASNAIRKLRGTVGEPTAVISAHRAPDAPGGGELRLSLSSPFEPGAAEGFRCPLHPLDRVGDVVSILVSLLRDCRVADIRTVAGMHGDRAAGTGLPLLFKPDTMPDSTRHGGH